MTAAGLLLEAGAVVVTLLCVWAYFARRLHNDRRRRQSRQ